MTLNSPFEVVADVDSNDVTLLLNDAMNVKFVGVAFATAKSDGIEKILNYIYTYPATVA